MTAREARARRVVGRARRTYLPLEQQRRKPSDYELTDERAALLPGARLRDFETPVWQHYRTHQRGSALSCPDWEAFEDPAHTTYSSYVAARRDQDISGSVFQPPGAGSARPLCGRSVGVPSACASRYTACR